MTRITPEPLIPEAKVLALKLGHATAICRKGSRVYVADSWQKADGQVLYLVGVNGQAVKAKA